MAENIWKPSSWYENLGYLWHVSEDGFKPKSYFVLNWEHFEKQKNSFQPYVVKQILNIFRKMPDF